MDNLRPLLFWLLMPVLFIFAHDAYLFSTKYPDNASEILQSEDVPLSSHFSDLGFLWNKYAPDSLEQVTAQLDESQLQTLTSVLEQKAVIVFLVAGILIFGIAFAISFFNYRTTHVSATGREHTNEFMGRQSKKLKYKRK